MDQLPPVARSEMPEPSDGTRLGEALIHVAQRLADEQSAGTAQIGRVLWWADFESYRERGRPVTGADYQKLAEGPAPVQLATVREQMIRDGSIVIGRRDVGPTHCEEIIEARRELTPGTLGVEDVAFLERGLAKFAGMSGTEAGELARRESVGWAAVDYGQTIPYATAIIDPHQRTEEKLEWARSLAIEQGLIPQRAN